MNAKLKRHFFYWVLPTSVILTYVLMYFSGTPVLQSIIAPAFNRELGLLESTQHLLLVAVIVMAALGLRRAEVPIERLGYGLATGLAVFQLLEELNYGYHYLNALGLVTETGGVRWNIHNRGISTPMKTAGDLVLFFYFFLLPLCVRPDGPAWLRFLSPPRLLALTVLCSVAVSKFAHQLNEHAELSNHVLESGVSEFRETFIYYVVLIYIRELVTNRRWPGWKGERGSPFKDQSA
ncbi:MAG TPA: hypothetical protein VNJ47_13855 [Nevskiales bacterium]|nr:hypothetical protein [Nevskiales bacterium]